ncbi:hypothetical protein [Sporosarcina phage Lietuvens]|nr:hypothetical protein [Sporosarcina phage Lietuvens]
MTKFKVGDKVRMLDKGSVSASQATRNGGVYEVIKVFSDGDIQIDDKSGGYPLLILAREFHAIERITEPTPAYRTVKRKARVGERILITDAEDSFDKYKNGDVLTVTGFHYCDGYYRVKTEPNIVSMFHEEYEVIVGIHGDAETQAILERISSLESETAKLKERITSLEFVLAEKSNITVGRNKAPNEKRADIIAKAKAFVAEHTPIAYVGKAPLTKEVGEVRIKFVVNAEKRTVVAIPELAHVKNAVVHYAKAVAKCDPSDVFNADIGRAIALGRALGKDVMEFEQAGQPTEVVVGMRMKWQIGNEYNVDRVGGTKYDFTDRSTGAKFNDMTYNNILVGATILDDTDAVYE